MNQSLSTYLQYALKSNKILRWPDKLMPLKIYISPFRWYENKKQQEAGLYNLFIAEALRIWSEATGGAFKYIIINDYKDSNINICWRRVNRSSLGLCHIDSTKECMIFSAEVEIGISDGVIHAAYQNTDEVKHTVIHEIGHAIGLPHSPYQSDIMFVPHQYGVVDISYRDKNTANWLYRLEPGFDPGPFLTDWGLNKNATLDELIWVYEHQDDPETLLKMQKQQQQEAQPQYQSTERYILDQHEILAHQNLFNLSLQHIKVDLNQKKKEIKKPDKPGLPDNNQPFKF